MKKKHTKLTIFAVIIYSILLALLLHFEQNCPNSSIKDFFTAVWYSMVTLSTVGYGDSFPVSTGGKIIGIIFILLSITLLSTIIGKTTEIIKENNKRKKMGFKGTDMTGHYVVVGYDKFAAKVIDILIKADKKVAVVTDLFENIDKIYNAFGTENLFVLCTDYSDVKKFDLLSIKNAKLIYINLPDDAAKLVSIININRQYPNLQYLVSLEDSDLHETFESIGVKYIISRNDIASKMIASYIFEPDVAELSVDLMSDTLSDNDYDIQQFLVKKGNPYIGTKFIDALLDIKKRTKAILLSISKKTSSGYNLIKSPTDDEIISEDDYLIMINNLESQNSIKNIFNVEQGRM